MFKISSRFGLLQYGSASELNGLTDPSCLNSNKSDADCGTVSVYLFSLQQAVAYKYSFTSQNTMQAELGKTRFESAEKSVSFEKPMNDVHRNVSNIFVSNGNAKRRL